MVKTNISYIKIICLNVWIRALFDKLELNYRIKLQSIPYIAKGWTAIKVFTVTIQVIQLIA
jgi:hypothetical protein